jgi:hypothetical protein
MLFVIDLGEPLECHASGDDRAHLRVHLIHPFEVMSIWMEDSLGLRRLHAIRQLLRRLLVFGRSVEGL